MSKISIWGSREESRVSSTRKETREREAASPLARSRALSRLASLAKNGELFAGYVLTSLHDPGWVVRIVSILIGIPVNKPLPHQDPPEVGEVTTT